MFIIPVGNRVDWKRPPIITLLLVLANCFIFFFVQSGDDRQDERAAEYYFSSGLPGWEFPRYAEYLESGANPGKAARFKELTDAHDANALPYMENDAAFMRELRAGHIIAADAPEYTNWNAQRKQYESMGSFTSRHIYRVGAPNALDAFSSAFMHSGFDHLFGNMAVLFLVGFLVETVIGRLLFALAYVVSIYASIFVFSLTAHGGALLGASGAIAGIMGLYTVIFGLRKIDFFYSLGFYFDYVRLPAIMLLPLWLGNELYQFLTEKGAHIAYMAHFGGLVGGALLGVLYRTTRPAMIKERHEMAESREIDQAAFQRGMDHLGALDFRKALAVFNALLEKHPTDANLAWLAYRAAKPEPASEDYHRAALRILSAQAAGGESAKRLHTVFREYMESAQPAPRLGHDLAAALAQRLAVAGQCDDAEKLAAYLQRGAPSHPQLPAVLLALAQGHHRARQLDKYTAALKTLEARFPDSAETKAARGLAHGG
jgi:membrane associated rhomboid family serine protease